MNMSLSLKKAESGAELLARLHSRPNPKRVDPFIFNDTSVYSSTSYCGGIIEIFGPEGVGKTELALNCAAKTCMPIESKGLELSGLGAKVIIIDTEFKFSILRLAVILEKQIKHVLSMKRNSVNINECKDSTVNSAGSDKELKTKASFLDCLELSNSDLEDIVKESLCNVQVLKVKNSQQLLTSLLSLESSIAEDPSYTLLIIDSISSFYWMDRVNDSDNKRKMTLISDALAQLIDKFGLACLAISSEFFNSSKNLHYKSSKGGAVNFDESSQNSWMNSEYLGKSWISTRRKRIILSRKEILDDAEHLGTYKEKFINVEVDNNVVHAFCTLTKLKQIYVFSGDFMQKL